MGRHVLLALPVPEETTAPDFADDVVAVATAKYPDNVKVYATVKG